MTNYITAQQALQLVSDKGAQIVDVRNPHEYSTGAAPGAVNIPVHMIPSAATTHLDVTKPVVVYCLSGGRSAQAQMILNSMGFNEVYNAGGIGSFKNM